MRPFQSLIIVGGGFSGVSLLIQLLNELKTQEQEGKYFSLQKIYWIERQYQMGRGLAYCTDLTSHSMNSRIGVSSAIADHPMDLKLWLERNYTKNDEKEGGEKIDPNGYIPRGTYARYLQSLAIDCFDLCKDLGIVIERIEDVGFQLTEVDGKFIVQILKGRSIESDGVILAMGDDYPQNYYELIGCPGYFETPWHLNQIFSGISPQDPVAILGTGLTAIDTYLTLETMGHKGKVYFVSRSGQLPKVQSNHPQPYQHQFLTLQAMEMIIKKKKKLRLSDVFRLLHSDLKHHCKGQGKGQFKWSNIISQSMTETEEFQKEINFAENSRNLWQEVLVSTYIFGPEIWKRLNFSDRKKFIRKYKSLFYRLFPMPVFSAKKLHYGLHQKTIKIIGKMETIRYSTEDSTFTLTSKNDPDFKVTKVINATGQGFDLSLSSNPLLRQLVHEGRVQKHELGGIQADPETFQIKKKNGKPYARFYGLGALLRGELLFTNGIPVLASLAHKLAKQITHDSEIRMHTPHYTSHSATSFCSSAY